MAWIGVDLDGTLAHYEGWRGAENIGKPVPLMLERVKKWLAEGKKVKILTARVSSNSPGADKAKAAIMAWCKEYIGEILEVTAEKDFQMTENWDDRARRVETNTGKEIG